MLQERGQSGASTTRDVPHPASTALSGSANSVLRRFCHTTVFVGQTVCSQVFRNHVLEARGSLLSTLRTNHTSPLGLTTQQVTEKKIKALMGNRERRHVFVCLLFLLHRLTFCPRFKSYLMTRGWTVLKEKRHTGASTMRDGSQPTSSPKASRRLSFFPCSPKSS